MVTLAKFVRLCLAVIVSTSADFSMADSPQAATVETPTRVTVSTGEPVRAGNSQQAIIGSCYDKEIVLRFFPLNDANSYLTVKVGAQPEQKYDATSPLVKGLFAGSKSSYQYSLFCNRDSAQTFLLTAWGASLASTEPIFLQAKVIFDKTGKLLSNVQPRAEDYEFVRRNLH